MCGIFGYQKQIESLYVGLLDMCLDTLRHCGPDMADSFHDRGLSLGFQRLAVLDLSVEGNQPMTSADGRYTIIFN